MDYRVHFSNETGRENRMSGCGYVELTEMINIADLLASKNGQDNEQMHNVDFTKLCLLSVPSHMIPTEILRFFEPTLEQIVSVSIFRHAGDSDKYFAVLELVSAEAARIILEEYNGQVLSSLDKVCCILRPVVQVVWSQEEDSPGGPTSTDRTADAATFKGASTDPTMVVSNSNTTSADDEACICPVCLEPIAKERPRTITTGCNHRFHIQCMMRLEGDQCPVCRFQHDSCAGLSAECMECGTRACSAIPDAGHGFSGRTGHHRARHSGAAFGGPRVDLWLCLICGYTGCGLRYGGHIQRHYEETLHTYAQNTESRQVWDFAGDGYVHRLILSGTAGSDGSPSSSVGGQKLVEAGNVAYGNAAGTRDHRPPLSDEQEDVLVSGKLEAAARHYNQLLAWQLEQNRLLYEARLRRIRESVAGTSSGEGNPTNNALVGNRSKGSSSTKLPGGVSGKLPVGGGSATWRENMLASLRTEKGKVAKQLEGAKERLQRAQKEAAVLEELRGGLETNRAEWQRRVEAASDTLRDAQATFQREIPVLEDKVRFLMEKLDMAPKTSTGTRGAPPGSDAEVSSGGSGDQGSDARRDA